ncbi:hypothetical protein BJ508DRAFT_378662 [Ascobolus immersus RN42]|uniref:Uncharacterized protein n=1 Tax=Ascobolus immersus RN42 TaxID=1160509 RepID=A0A3N4I7T6_ASCIM|nr:hypothetical protein BJ508DRAFT_378662 [Ascobolus immersus RN42]
MADKKASDPPTPNAWSGAKNEHTLAKKISGLNLKDAEQGDETIRRKPSIPNLGSSSTTSLGLLRHRPSQSSFKMSGLSPSELGPPVYPLKSSGVRNKDVSIDMGELIILPTKYNMGGIDTLSSSFTEGSDRDEKTHPFLVSSVTPTHTTIDGKFQLCLEFKGYFVRSFGGKDNEDPDPAGLQKYERMVRTGKHIFRIPLPSQYAPIPSRLQPPLETNFVAQKAAWVNIACEHSVMLPKNKFVKRFVPPALVEDEEFTRLLEYRATLPGMDKYREELEERGWMVMRETESVSPRNCSTTASEEWEEEREWLRSVEDIMVDAATKRRNLEEKVICWLASISD